MSAFRVSLRPVRIRSRKVSRVPDQNGVFLLYIMLEIHHSGLEPSVCIQIFKRWSCNTFKLLHSQFYLRGSPFRMRFFAHVTIFFIQPKRWSHQSSSMETEYDYPNGWIKNGHIRKNLTYNGEPQRSSWGTMRRRHPSSWC